MSSAGAPGGTDPARPAGIEAAGVGDVFGGVPVGELHAATTPSTTSAPASEDGRTEVYPALRRSRRWFVGRQPARVSASDVAANVDVVRLEGVHRR